jgi:hypothetical protein
MKKTKKTAKKTVKKIKVLATHRELKIIVAEIRETLRTDTAAVVRRGGLLIEAKDIVDHHGDWLPWLDDNFGMDPRTAQKAMAAARFVAKYESDSYLNLSVGALYAISGSSFAAYTDKAVAAILREAATKHVNEARAFEIALATMPPVDSTEAAVDTENLITPEQEAAQENQDILEAAAAAAIIDGPPPELPPTAPPPLSPGKASMLMAFEQACQSLRSLMTKPAAKFTAATVAATDLLSIADFKQVAATKATNTEAVAEAAAVLSVNSVSVAACVG